MRLLAGLCATLLSTVLLAGTCNADQATVQYETHCSTLQTSVEWGYCISSPENTPPSGKVVYVFHPFALNEDYFKMIPSFSKALSALSGEKPTIVVASFHSKNFSKNFAMLHGLIGATNPIFLMTEAFTGMGPRNWMLSEPDKNTGEISGLYPIYINEVIPEIEQHVLKYAPTERDIIGVSMGGLSAVQLIVKPQSSGLFKKAVLIDPFIVDANPFNESEWNDYFLSHGPNSEKIKELWNESLSETGVEKQRTLSQWMSLRGPSLGDAKLTRELITQYFEGVPDASTVYLNQMDPFHQLSTATGPMPDVYFLSSTWNARLHPSGEAWADLYASKFPGKMRFETEDSLHGVELSIHGDLSAKVAQFLSE